MNPRYDLCLLLCFPLSLFNPCDDGGHPFIDGHEEDETVIPFRIEMHFDEDVVVTQLFIVYDAVIDINHFVVARLNDVRRWRLARYVQFVGILVDFLF